MDGQAIVDLLKGGYPEGAIEIAPSGDGMPSVYVAREHLQAVCRDLRDRPELRFAFAADVTAVDFMPREPRYEVVYHVASLGLAGFGDAPNRLRIKVRVPGNDPRIPTTTTVWPAMNWAERELWDMFGVHVEGHPDMRRILMPDDWEGYPGRKDYPVQIKKPYKVFEPLQLTQEEFVENVQATRDRARQE
ncbi:MAG TPA: NADH-quinone oxidoreductase subunit C [Vicinamibacterales bacterium]|jgi:NADH-quinone oxidoreductase subunit C|nr:NADH-quinone oxidoreductase subunit C [Vicinamibacterales bacterium]